MSEEEQVQDLATEDHEQETQVEQQPEPVVRQVPLEALEAERRKRQELEHQLQMLQKKEPDEDEEEWISRGEMKRRLQEAAQANKREVLEEAFCDANPEAVQLINAHLENIIKRKPWLAQTLENAPNRFARAYEIVQDYMPQEKPASAQKFSTPKADAKKIVENSQKPGNPSAIAKSSNMSNADYLKSIAGKPEFREYRKKVMAGG